jgi:hypothetical protein
MLERGARSRSVPVPRFRKSFAQSNTLALANLNFDFSLVKLAAPPEFESLGACLSKKRKSEAEDGRLHRVARKLGALFADDLPNTPHLFQAYGQRVSEIAGNPKVNPKGNQSDGAFQGFVGADGTSIWAAATSGKGALAVHLLGCMLARIWSGPEAVSIWSELVTERKAVLMRRIQEEQFQLSIITASQIEISRNQLAEWDASARSVSLISRIEDHHPVPESVAKFLTPDIVAAHRRRGQNLAAKAAVAYH